MRCPDGTCGFETEEGRIKFCPDCGNKLISNSGPDSIVVICNGKLEDGSSCAAELNQSQKFCMNCGSKVDSQLFSVYRETCTECGTLFTENSPFCGECGFKRKRQAPIQDNQGLTRTLVSFKEVKHIRLVYCLANGCTKVASSLVLHYVRLAKPVNMQDTEWTIDEFLQRHTTEDILRRLRKDQLCVLFPRQTARTNINHWDLALLFFVLEMCKVDRSIKDDISHIKKMRNKLYHMGTTEITDTKYSYYKEKIAKYVNNCCQVLQDDSIEREVMETFKEVDRQQYDWTGKDLEAFKTNFYEWCKHDLILDRLTDLSAGQRVILSRIDNLEKVVNKGFSLLLPDPNIGLQVKNCDKKTTDQISQQLRDHICDNVSAEQANSTLGQAITEAKNELLAEGRTLMGTSLGCVILSIRCPTFSSLQSLFTGCVGRELIAGWKRVEAILRQQYKCDGLKLEVGITNYEFWRCIEELVKGLTIVVYEQIGVDISRHFASTIETHPPRSVWAADQSEESAISEVLLTIKPTSYQQILQIWDEIKSGRFDEKLGNISNLMAEMYEMTELSITAYMEESEELEELFHPTRSSTHNVAVNEASKKGADIEGNFILSEPEPMEEESAGVEMESSAKDVTPEGANITHPPEIAEQGMTLSTIQKNVGELTIMDTRTNDDEEKDKELPEEGDQNDKASPREDVTPEDTPNYAPSDHLVTQQFNNNNEAPLLQHDGPDLQNTVGVSTNASTIGDKQETGDNTEPVQPNQESSDTNASEKSLKRKTSDLDDMNKKKVKETSTQDETSDPNLAELETQTENMSVVPKPQEPVFGQGKIPQEKMRQSDDPIKKVEYSSLFKVPQKVNEPAPLEGVSGAKNSKVTDDPGDNKNMSVVPKPQEPVFGQGKTLQEKMKQSDDPIKKVEYSSLFKVPIKVEKVNEPALLEAASGAKNSKVTDDPKDNKMETDAGSSSTTDKQADKPSDSSESDDEDDADSRRNRRSKRNLKKENDATNNAKASAENKKDSKPQASGKPSKSLSKERCVLVHFHVLLSEEFKFDPKQHKLLLRIGDPNLGNNWQRMDREMKFHRETKNKFLEMSYDLEIPARLISHGDGRFEYKYCIIKPEKAATDKKDEEKGTYWELYYRNKNSGVNVNRILKLIEPWKNSDIWHQYDGVMMKEKKGMLSNLSNWWSGKSDMVNYACWTAEYFCPNLLQLSSGGMSVQEIMDHLEMLMRCLWKIYYSDFKCWDDDKDFKTKIGNLLLTKMMDSLNDVKEESTPEYTEQRFTIALIVVFVLKNLKLNVDTKMGQKLCSALLVQPDPDGLVCKELLIVDKYFSAKRKPLKEALVNLGKQVAMRNTCKDSSWLFLMPLIHFLSDVCKPYGKPECDLRHDGKVPIWWGISHIGEDTLKAFKKSTVSWTVSKKKIIEQLKPLFSMDYYLPRTIMSAMELGDLKEIMQADDIPVEICIAVLIYFLKISKQDMRYSFINNTYVFPDMSYEERKIQDILIILVERLNGFFCSGNECLTQWKMSYKLAYQLLTQARLTDRHITLHCCAQLLVHCLAVYDRILDKDQNKPVDDDCKKLIEAATTEIVNWVQTWFWNWNGILENMLQWWNNITAQTEIQSVKIRDLWNERVVKDLSFCLNSKVCNSTEMMSTFVRIYCREVDKFNPCMQECMSKVAFKAIGAGYTVDYVKFSNDECRRFGYLLSNLFIAEWYKVVKTGHNSEDEMVLKHVLRWPPFLHYFRIYYTDQKKFHLLSSDCLNLLAQAESAVHSRITALLSGAITVGNLNMIGANDSRFPEVAEMVKLEKGQTQAFLSKAISVRKREMQAFSEQAELVTTLTTLCTHLSVNVKFLDETLSKQRHLEEHQVKEFCSPSDVAVVIETKEFSPKPCAFKLSDEVLGILLPLHECNKSSTFFELWEKQCTANDGECETLDDVVKVIWIPVKKRWENLTRSIQDGSITFQQMEKYLGRIYKDDYESMHKELLHMALKKEVINKRIDQLQKYRQLGACLEGAKVILKFQKEFKLTGDFQQIKDITEDDRNVMEMRAFDESVMKTCEFLKDVTKIKGKCLDEFVKCGQLVNWLKASMASGLKELKVFVDLAFMSAGDEPINIKRVQCLHTAVTGYAPLIFDLKPDIDYKEFLNLCGLVWKELAADENLPQKLRDTNLHLEWLKDIEKAHGSVEVTSLIQSDAINDTGIYTVGRKASKEKTGDKDEAKDLGRSMKLTVSEIEGKRQLRNYTFENLQDLQSRLMLVAGKAEKSTDSVDRFTFIFDSVIRLSNVHIKLCSAGCVLFKEWTARFLCDRKKPVCAVLEFGQGEGSPTLKAKRNKEEDLMVIIPKIAKFMEDCLENWLEYIKEKRSRNLHLNYFTIDQLVILQKELMKMGTDEQPSLWIYPLLSAVKKNCTQEDLLAAMNDAKQEIDRDVDMESDNGDDTVGDQAEPIAETEDELRQAFIRELVEAGFDERLALKALEHVDENQIEEGIVWCLNHEDEMEEEEEDPTQIEADREPIETQKTSPTFEGWSQSTTSIQSLIRSNIEGLKGTKGSSVDSLLSDLDLLWNEFKGSISSNIKDYLNLEHLGKILEHLADRETSRIFRQFPPSFQEGSPNLIICPSVDVLNTALSLYMLEKDQPLPQPDEILMCTPRTTIDEVDIFWRRAIFGEGEKIHCLVNADFLDFDVSDAAERYLEKYIQETNFTDTQRYRLVVICGSDNEYRSRIVASLDKHRRPALPIHAAQLREYLGNKLQVNKTDGPVRPAAFVDFNKSTVRVVKSWRAGVGKTLYKSRRVNDLERLNGSKVKATTVSIPLQEKVINLHHVITRLLQHTSEPGSMETRIFHIDVAHEVQDGVDYLLFNLLVLGSLTDKTGFVWRKSAMDLYIIETLPLMILGNNRRKDEVQYVHQMLNILPDMTCRSPQDSLNVYAGGNGPNGYADHDQLFDGLQFKSPIFQRPYQYLYRLDQGKDLRDVQPQTAEGTPQLCLQTLLRHCGVEDPSWAELHHFVWFLNTQLRDFEQNSFVGAAAAEDLPGFAQFVLRFLIQMSRDFSTRSLNMSEESPGLRFPAERMEGIEGQEEGDQDGNQALEQYQLRRTWESSPHPYLFFNADHFTFTFLGFYIDRASGNLIDQATNQVLERGIMQHNLYDSLVRNFVPIRENFDALPRAEKIQKMCNVMGIDMVHDPDDTYELTTDNVKKIMAIYMRFRCDIPVIIMGETGCGKTRLVKFMCSLQMPPGVTDKQNMILMKVHGGTTNADIIKKVREAERIAQKNVEEIGPHMYTVLFFDEANTTESIGLIKEIMCDKSMEGQKLKLCENLKMVAACNPYRKHSEELIKKLEQAGLGYHVDADNTMDKLGRVPMRRLVYRVQPLPQSLLPLVWDFGQLNTQVEDLYIRQMVKRYIRDDRLPGIPNMIAVVSAILTASQDYMRAQKDECSFVSLRDVDRVLSVMSWFYEQSQDQRTLFDKMDAILGRGDASDSEYEDEEEENMDAYHRINDVTRSLVLSLGVCYHACLKTRPEYREHIAPYFEEPLVLSGGADQIEEEITCCQDVFLENVQLEKNIAKNMALKENLFMMVVCIELRIPLFLVGKPGSSKSLAKTIVSDAMQGNASREDLFKELKQAQMVSFQCSPLSTPDGIVGTFRQCAQFQKDKDLNTFVSIVVLDEVGLAEDSPRMPLKTLHPLLEDGCQGDETPEPYMKVAFIGISNWALDPAKMNRGILVQREVPGLEELKNSAKGITGKGEMKRIKPLIKPMCKSYLMIFERASKNTREFFGLRDFYSLVKMVNAFAEKSKQTPTWFEMLHAIKRNFGGLEQEKVDPVECFKEKLTKVINIYEERKETDPDCRAAGLIDACLFERNRAHGESRYLLLLTENYGSLSILQQQIMSKQKDIKPITIFGSSFRSDQEYTQVCRNINKIKVCMETGNTVVLLNLENLYESLYDALNQYYVYFGGERYVDLGLGTHRVKCPVHKKFRLIVVAEKQTVYDKFPIPLINRLEKHFLTINTMLSPEQQALAQKLEKWARQFVKQNRSGYGAQKVGDVFMGYHDDTCAAIILQVWENSKDRDPEKILKEGKALLLWVATPDAVVRLEESALPLEEQKALRHVYFKQQKHDSIVDYLHQKLVVEEQKGLFVQVTTHSKLLATFHKTEISKVMRIPLDRIMLLDTLSSFDTEQQFSNKIQQHLQKADTTEPCLLIIQCDSGDINANLVACARYCVMDEYQKLSEELRASVHVVFIVQLPNIAGGCYTGFQCGVWHSVHIDDLWVEDLNLPAIEAMQNKSVSNLIQDAVQGPVPMETVENEEDRNTTEAMEWQGEGTMSTDRDTVEGMEVEEPVPSTSSLLKGMDTEEAVPSTSSLGDALAQKGPLNIDDVIIGFETAGKEKGGIRSKGSKEYVGRSLNVKDLILSCTQAALSMLKDKAENNQRTTERVALVLTLFHGKHLQGYDLFLQGMCSLIASLLKEKEKSAYRPENWLTSEAAKPENIQKAGTFRRSCLQTLESKISPILAGIIAHLDTNQNLDILDDTQLPWKHELWLAILNDPGALQLKYSDLQSPKRQSDLQEVVVITTGCEGRIFKARMPFSWLIHQQLNEILREPMPTKEDNESPGFYERLDFYVGVFDKTPLGKVIAGFTDCDNVTDIAEEYLHDFMCMRYLALSEDEFELVRKSVRYKYNQLTDELGENSLSYLLLCVHEAYTTLAPRLTYFHTMNIVWPECSATIVKLKEQNPDHVMFQEQECTFSTLCLLIEHLTPTKNELDRPEGRSKWLNKVHAFRPVVDKVLRLHREDETIYGAHSYRSVHRARCLWSRVVVMKLFLEHVCTEVAEENITVKYFMTLWKILGEEANLQEIKSLEGIEKILKICNKKAIQEFLGKQEKCCYCEEELEGPPIVLPCKDLFCDQCYQNIRAFGDNSCLKCQKPIPQNWTLERQTEKTAEKTRLKNYQKRCNSFFMDVVSQLCFYDNTPPSDEVIDRLLEYITCTTKGDERTQRHVTKEMTIFNTGLDPNPVFRSFLLQLLVRTSEQKVMENLTKYLKHADILIQTHSADNNTDGYIKLALLVIQCLEDILTQEMSASVEKEEGIKCLKGAQETIFTDELNVEKLYGLAEARIGLRIAAKTIAELVQHQRHDVNSRKLIEAAQVLCENGYTDFPRIYLVKYMCRCYGIDVYQTVCRSEIRYLMWIGMKGRQENQRVEISDRLVLCGDTYTTIRESLTKVVLGEESQHLNDTLQELRTAQGHVHVLFPLAIYREITCSLLYPQQQRKVTDKVVTLLQNYIQDSEDIKDKALLLKCLQNSLGHPSCPHLTVREGSDFRLQGMQCLLTHFLVVISQIEGDRTLLHPLVGLTRTPQAFNNGFLPTMPQDDLEDVKEALLAARGGSGENPVFYRCPNGHPYVIGNCGRPATVGVCKECSSVIGGEGYQLRPGNIQHQGNDETQTGHILGPAESRGPGPRPEREMSPLYCACVRLLTHMAMYLGTSNNLQAIHAMITPAILDNGVSEFLWRHIQVDLEDLQRGLGKSPDDTFVLLHAVIDNMMRKYNKGERIGEEACRLSSKKGRRDWETRIYAQYLQPIFQDSDRILQQANQRIVQDHRLGADPLLCLLYEIDTQQEEENPNHLEKIPAVWRYRSPITLEHLRQEFEAKKASTGKRDKQLKVLELFLKEEHYLRAIRCIPSILKLQRELFNKYQRKLDKAEASQITIEHIMKEKIAGEESSQLVDDFIIAWNICRDSLEQYLCPTELGGMPVPKDYCRPITADTPIAILLPAVKDEGLCSYALLDLLMRKQNDFLDKYINETTKSKKRSPDHMTKVQPMDVTPAHLISYDPQQDLLPLILANCQYSFEIGKGTKIEYDFTSLERQIMDRFLFSKSKIDVGPVLKIDLMLYRAEFTNGEVFKKLEEKIPQDGLSSAVKTQICAEIRTLPDLCQSLYSLDITISFLKSIGGDPNDNLHGFMSDTLKMKETVLSQKARQACQFQHIQSLWLLLALEKSKKMAEHRRPIENMFDSVGAEFQEYLSREVEEEFREYMKAISIDRLGELVSLLHEYILLRVAVRQNTNDEDYVDTTSLKLQDWLPAYHEDLDRGDSLDQILAGFPDTILYKHSIHAWVTAYSMMWEKRTGDRKF